MFKHEHSPLVHSSRRASGRLHRRPALPAMTLSTLPQAVLPTTGGRMHYPHVRRSNASGAQTAMLELLAAEAHIRVLEQALSDARATALADPLTGALNRRGFEDAYRREVARARRHGSRLALALIDLDDFKRLNDTLGHQAGDEALVHLVMELRAALRPSDILCRFGGEEFVVLLPETALPEAAAAISRFQRQFAANAVPGRDVVVTFSAGVVLHELTESLADSMVRADTATYAAKRAGKNCVVTA
jgi:diguanylate cyclase